MMLRSLTATPKELNALRDRLKSEIHSALELSRQDYVDFDCITVPGGREQTYQFVCERHGEFALDDRGAELPVLEIVSGRGWRALLGLSVTWARETKNRSRFLGSQLILFLERLPRSQSTPAKQVMRLEWEALDLNSNYDNDIAHPHWQMDLANFAEVRTDKFIHSEPRARDSIIPATDVPDLSWSSKLHLAATARWMTAPWGKERPLPHVSGPQNMDELLSWMASSCRYVRFQLEEAFGE